MDTMERSSHQKRCDETTLPALTLIRPSSTSSTTPNNSTWPSMPSRPTSVFKRSSSRSPSTSIAPSRHSQIGDYDVHDPFLIAKYIARRATLLGWFDEPAEMSVVNGLSLTGVAIKSNGSYIFQPTDIDPHVSSTVSKLDAEAVISISSDALVSIINTISPTQRSLVCNDTGARIPIVPSLEDVTPEMCHYSRACVALEEQVVLIWSQDAKNIVSVANNVQQEILHIAQTPLENELEDNHGRALSDYTQRSSSTAPVATPNVVRGGLNEKSDIFQRAIALEENESDNDDLEKDAPVRPKLKMHAFKISFGDGADIFR